MRLSIVFTIFRKEITEALRDRITLFVVIVLPMLVYPLMITGVGKLQRSHEATEDKRASIIAVWGEASPLVLEWLRRSNTLTLEIEKGLPDPLRQDFAAKRLTAPRVDESITANRDSQNTLGTNESPVLQAAREVVASRDADVVLVLWPGLSEAMTQHGLGSVSIYHDSVRPSSQKAQDRLSESLDLFRRDLVQQRERERGLVKGFSSALKVRSENIAPPKRRTGQVLGFGLPFVLIMLSATGALYASIDLTAGEKDRTTMQTLLCAPVRPLEIVAGKFFAVWGISLIASIANTASLGFTIGRVAAELGGLSVSPWTVMMVLPCLLPITCTISALFLAVAVLARDAKDAGNFLSATLVVLMMPMGITLAPGVELTAATAFVPMVNVALLVKTIFIGEAQLELAFLTLLAAALYAMLALLFAARAFSQEQVLLGGKGAARALFLPARVDSAPPSPGLALGVFALILVAAFYGSLGLRNLDLVWTILITQYGFFLLPVVALTAWMKFPVRETFSLRLPHWRSVLGCVLLGASSAVAVAGVTMRLLPAPESLVEGMQKLLLLGETPAPLWMVWLVIAVTPALCEETVFRGLILGGFRRLGAWKAIAISALLFSVAHSSIYRLLPTFGLGLIFGYAVWCTRSLYCSIFIHMLNNGLIATLVHSETVAGRLNLQQITVVPWSWTILAAFVVAMGLWLLRPPGQRTQSGSVPSVASRT